LIGEIYMRRVAWRHRWCLCRKWRGTADNILIPYAFLPTTIYSQFHQKFIISFFTNVLAPKNYKSKHRKSAQNTLGVNFISILLTHFLHESLLPAESLALNKLLYKKRSSKMLMKLTVVQKTDFKTLVKLAPGSL